MLRRILVLAVLSVLAVPAAASAATTDFGTVTAGTSGPTQTVTLDGPLAVGKLGIFGSAFHPVTPLSTCEHLIPAGSHCDLQFQFAPEVAGEYRGRIDSDGAPVALLSGIGAAPGAPAGGIGTALVISQPASSLPTAFTAHVRWHKASARHIRRHRAAMRARRHRRHK